MSSSSFKKGGKALLTGRLERFAGQDTWKEEVTFDGRLGFKGGGGGGDLPREGERDKGGTHVTLL